MKDLEIHPGSVKICSLREPEHAEFVVASGADFFGLIFAPARRQVTPERAREIVSAVRALSGNRCLLAVGVFVDATAQEINLTASIAGLDAVQLQGEEPPGFLSELHVPAIKSVRPRPVDSEQSTLALLDRFMSASRPPIAFHIEGFNAAHKGGEGATADWSLAARIARDYPVILAGGLNPGNVADAIATVRPLMVDVSSGVETDGLKDRSKIVAFAQNAKSAFAALSFSGIIKPG